MKAELLVAGVSWFVLCFGHTMIGLRWVLPNLRADRLPGTPFGSPSLTLGMLRFTWNIVSVMLLGFGILFMMLAWAPDADSKTLVLRWVAGVLVSATALAFWQVRRRPRSILRFPVPLVFVVIAVMSWAASV
jgi:hypothetical protein